MALVSVEVNGTPENCATLETPRRVAVLDFRCNMLRSDFSQIEASWRQPVLDTPPNPPIVASGWIATV